MKKPNSFSTVNIGAVFIPKGFDKITTETLMFTAIAVSVVVTLTNTYDYVVHINYYGLCYFL